MASSKSTPDMRIVCMESSQALNELLDLLLQSQIKSYDLNHAYVLEQIASTDISVSPSFSHSSSVSSCSSALTANDVKCKNIRFATVQLLALIRLQNVQLIAHLRWLLQAGRHFDHSQQQANGFYSFARLSAKLQKHTLKKLEPLRKQCARQYRTSKAEHDNASSSLTLFGKHLQTLFELSVLFDYQLNVLRRLAVSYGQVQHDASTDHCDSCAAQPDPLHTDLNHCPASSICKSFVAHSELSADGSSNQLFLQPMRMYVENNTFTAEPKAQIALTLLFGRHGPFWYHHSARKLFKLIRALFLVGGTRSLSTKVLSPHRSGQALAHQSAHSSLRYVTNAFQFTDLRAYNRLYFSLLKLPICTRYRTRTIHLHVQTELIIPDGEQSQLDRPFAPVDIRKVRCRLLRSTDVGPNSDTSQTLIFHCHGGGFTINSPDAHEIYLRDWASKLTSATILSVDYRLRDKFPGALQDVLDAYLAVAGFSFQRQSETVTNQSQRILGFRPKRILLLGDSCGGNLIMGLLCLLNEIRRLHPAHRLLMPFAVCPIYPVFDLRAVCSASRLLGAFDPILHNGNLLSMHGCYGGMQAELSDKVSWFLPDQASKDLHRVDDNNNNPSNSNHHDAASTEHSRTKATAEDTDRRDQVVIDRFWKVHQRLSGPFASPLTYPHLAQLADIQLHLVGSHICPLLDDAIQMYQKWAGPRSLLMFDDLPHGFIQFVDQCKESRKATARIGEMIALILSQPNRNENPAYPVLKVNSQSVPVDPVISLIRAN